jgi:transcriptional regulator of acetoin/glycerol metabolism
VQGEVANMNFNAIGNYLLDPSHYIETVKKDWDRFISTGKIDGLSVRNEILRSWERSLQSGVSYESTSLNSNSEINNIIEKNSLLVTSAEPLMNDFCSILQDCEEVLNLCDSDGIILKTMGGSTALSHAEEQYLLPGRNLSEPYSGTTGVSMVKITKKPYAIYGYEHFPSSAKSCFCSAAPIIRITDGEIAGIIALSGSNLKITPQTMGMISFIAKAIESRIYSVCLKREAILMEKFRNILLRSKASMIIAIDTNMKVISASKLQHPLLGQSTPYQQLNKKFAEHIKKEVLLSPVISESHQRKELRLFENYSLFCLPVYESAQIIGFILEIDSKASSAKEIKQFSAHINPISSHNAPVLIGNNPVFTEPLKTAKHVAKTDAPIILLGETGVGKEEFAKTIYYHSNRADKPFIAVNCGAIPKELIASELFGYSPGAFTGALAKGAVGKIEAANGGTIFLDELGELPLDSQTFLLRVLQEKEIVRIGSVKPIKVDIRVIAATNANLQQLVKQKLFRSDLYFRLNVIQIEIPPLRQHLDDLPLLIEYFNNQYSGVSYHLEASDLKKMSQYHWPGNVREVMNLIQRAAILSKDPVTLLLEYVESQLSSDTALIESSIMQKENNEDIIMTVVRECNGNISKAAKQLGVARSTIYRRISKLQRD